jgi:hypothetical protein
MAGIESFRRRSRKKQISQKSGFARILLDDGIRIDKTFNITLHLRKLVFDDSDDLQ